MKDTLCNQSLMIQKLYTDLEEERKSSATAAEEALSMILRLQEEKALEKLEACQYKRLAEEKMHHAEESLAFLEEAMIQREIENSSLKYQLQAYRHKFLSNSVINPDFEELKISDSQVTKISNTFLDKQSISGFVKRNMSLPAVCLNQLCSERDIIDEAPRDIDEYRFMLNEESGERERKSLTEEHVIEECGFHQEPEENSNIGMKQLPHTRSSRENIWFGITRENNELQKELAEKLNTGIRQSTHTRNSRQKVGPEITTEYNELQKTVAEVPLSYAEEYMPRSKVDHTMNSLVGDLKDKSACEAFGTSYFKPELNGKTHNYYTVNNSNGVEQHSFRNHSEPCEIQVEEPKVEAKNVISTGKSCLIPQEAVASFLDGDLHSALGCSYERNKLPISSETASFNHLANSAEPGISIGSSQTNFEQLMRRMEHLENAIKDMRREYSNGGKEQIKLLKELQNQLSTINVDAKNSKAKMLPPHYDSSLVLLREAMVSFWL